MRSSLFAVVCVAALSLTACAKHSTSGATSSAGCCAGKGESAMCKHEGHEGHEAHATGATATTATATAADGAMKCDMKDMKGEAAMACAHEAGHEAKGEMCDHKGMAGKDGKDCCAKMASAAPAATPAATPAPTK